MSGVLTLFGLISELDLTVDGTAKDLHESGWHKRRNKRPHVGDVLVWQALESKDGSHKYIGFYLGKNKAISNNTSKRKISVHHVTFAGKRAIAAIYYNRKVMK